MNRAKRYKRILLIIAFFLIFIQIISISVANDLDDGNAQDMGWVSIGLFAVSILYVIVYHAFLNANKLARKNEKFNGLRDASRNVFMKAKKPLSYLHYLAGFVAVAVILTHGISLILIGGFDPLKITIGITMASIYVYYVVLGFLIKVVLKNPKRGAKLKKIFYKVHTNLIIIILVGVLHIIHLAIDD